MTVRRKALLGGGLAIAMFAFLVSPTQAGTTTLASLAAQVSKIVKQVKNLTSSGTLPSKYVTYKDARKVLPGSSVGAVLDNIAKGSLPASAVKYSGTTSGLQGKTVQAALDEVGVSVKKLISGTSVSAAGAVKASALSPTTWKGYGYNSQTYPLANGLVSKTSEITVTFTPITETTGTFTSSPLYIFAPKGGELWDAGHPDSLIGRCGTSYSGITYPTGTYTGKYEIVDDILVWSTPETSSHATCKIPPSSGYAYSSYPSRIENRGGILYITNPSYTDQIILQRQ